MDSTNLSIINERAVKLSGPSLLHHLISPSSTQTALDYTGHNKRVSFTYSQLHQAANALASRITRATCNVRDRKQLVVPILVHQSPLLYISLLGILKAGGAFCPLNIDAPPERVKFILDDVDAAVVVVSRELRDGIPEKVGPNVIVVDDEDCEAMIVPNSTKQNIEHRKPTPQDLAYVMYTSGSTGTPKGVGLSHDAATQALLAHDKHIPAFSRFLQFAAPTFDVSVFEIFFPLFRGCTLVSVRRAEMLNDLPAVINGMDVDACELTPTVAGSLLRKRENAPGLKVLLTIGEMLNAPVVEEFGGDDTKPSMLWAMYGPTEATIHCTLQPAFSADSGTGNIGIPLDTVSCFIIEEFRTGGSEHQFNVLPQGEIGELAVGGHQLAVGYINRPEQTESVFIQTPYGRVYRTGDKARLRSDGNLECLGRISDGQVKLRGQRLELGEIEQAVLRTSGCHSAVAAVVNSILVAFCAVDEGISEDTILEKCKDWLPQYMVPGEIVLMEEFPRLASGKVDRKRMKAECEQQKTRLAENSTAVLDPTDELEARVTTVVSDVLGVRVDRDTSLALAGLDSLRAIKLASALRAEGFELSSSSMLSMKSAADLVFAIRRQPPRFRPEARQISFHDDLDSILDQNPVLNELSALIEEILPCIPSQSAMLAETAQNAQAYCNEVELSVPQGFTPEQVSASFMELTRRNEILRSGFTIWNGGFVSVVFKSPRNNQIRIVNAFTPEFAMSNPEDYLHPLRIQIRQRSPGESVSVLVHIHHAIYDGWSMDMLLSDLSSLLLGDSIPLRPQFRDVVGFYHDDRTQAAGDAARVFWTEHLVGWNKVPFPKLLPRNDSSNNLKSICTRLAIPKRKFEVETERIGCSAQVLFQASLALVWSNIVGVQDVLIGSVTSGRTIPMAGVENVVGPCIASLPLRVNMSTMTANLDVLNNIHASNREAMQHCCLPLGDIKKLAGLKPGESFYDVLFAYQESLDSPARARNLIKETRHLDRLEIPVLFEVEPSESGFTLQITYRPAGIPTPVIENVVRQFEAVSLRLLDDSAGTIKTAERNLDVCESEYNHASCLSEETMDLAKAFEMVASNSPELDALCFATQISGEKQITTVSFRELNAMANRIAWGLRTQGSQLGEVVAIVLDKSIHLYASILAVVKAGCAYLPILPATPTARIEEIFRQAEIKRCLVDNTSRMSVPAIPEIKLIDVDSTSMEDKLDTNLDIPVSESRLAYVIYTSGTTGVPKGVAVTQQNIMSNLAILRSMYPRSQKSTGRLLQICSQAFDVSVFEIFYTWHAGMCLCSGSNDTLFGDIENAIDVLQITHLSMTPTVASLVDPQNVPSVEFLVTAGEALTQAVLDKWHALLWQGYGPSELTNICSLKKMRPGDHVEHLGHGLPNTSSFVLFPGSLDVTPIGWTGELCFGGSQVADGYLNMPNVSGEKFIQHPKYGRLYRTGDLGRMLPDGSLIFLGRIDTQIKLRGQRIEASEINSIATSTEVVSSAVTMLARQGKNEADQLVLFYVIEKGQSVFLELDIDPEIHRSLFVLLQSRLPGYMVPSYLIPVSTIPLNSNGKVDSHCLLGLFETLSQSYLETASGSSQDSNENEDWTSIETVIAETVATAMKISRQDIGRWTPLAMLGIDSISAIQLSRELGTRLNRRVAVSEILRHGTTVQLARYLSADQQQPGKAEPAEFFTVTFVTSIKNAFAEKGRDVETILPCMPLQEAMLSRGQRGYYNKILLRLHVEPDVISRYWKAMAQRHEILRTCFISTTDSQRAIAQVVLKEFEIPWINLDVAEPSFDGAVQEHLRSLPDPIDSHIPPVSLSCLRYRGSAFLSFICHHALYDAVAMERLLKEIEALASGAELPPPVSYEAFLHSAMALADDVEQFWQDHFHGYRPSSLFAAMTSEMNQSLQTTSLDLPLTELQKSIRNLGTSLLSVCQASWASVLSMAHGKPDVCFGNVVSGRTLSMEGLERLVAPCFNTIPVRANFSTNWSNIELVKQLHKVNTELLAYQFTPLRLIQRTVNRTGRHLFDTLLLVQKPLQDMDSTVWTLEADSGDMDIPLVCEVVPCPSLNSLVINIYRDMSLVTGDVASALAEAFKLVLKSIVSSPHATVMSKARLPLTVLSELGTLKPRQERPDMFDHLSVRDENWSDVEIHVRKVLSQLSGAQESQIHRPTTIFQLGLDSINAVQIASILRSQGFNISASDVIECPSCAKISAKLIENSTQKNLTPQKRYDIDQFERQVSSDIRVKLPDDTNVEAILPCTPVQCAMIASFLQSGGEHYLNAVRYEIDQDIRVEDLREAWEKLQSNHPMLRTGFVSANHGDASFAMVRYSMKATALPVEIRQDQDTDLLQRKRHITQEIQASLRLPPWRVVLTQGESGNSMDLVIHHALYDAPSLHLMLDGLTRVLKREQPSRFSAVEPALSIILNDSIGRNIQGKDFWETKASQIVVNKFPVMTTLRIDNRTVKTDALISSLPFSKLQQATQSSNISVQAAIQAAWTRVLASYLGESSVVFGVVLSGRTTDETKDAPLPCLNTVPVVASNSQSNEELLNYMMDYNQHLHKHQFSPLSQVQKWLGHPAGAIFDTLIAYQKMETKESVVWPWKAVADEAMVEYPVSLEIEPIESDQLRLCITYYNDVLPEPQARLLVKQFDLALAHLAHNPTGNEDDTYNTAPQLYSILPPSHPTLNAPVQLLHQFVERRATTNAEKIALEFVSGFNLEVPIKQQWTFKEFNDLGGKVAHILKEKAAPGSIVAIHFDKCPEAYFSILGILKAGCSFVALDPTAPAARKQFIIEDSKAPCLLTTDPKALGFEVDCAVVPIDKNTLQAMPMPHSEYMPAISPSDTCYCLYTSGTTGTPKGCEITHDNAVEAMMAFQELFRGHWDDESRWLQFASLHFDVSVLEQYWSWSVGMAVVAAPKDLILDDLTATINRLNITHIDLTPSLARLTHPDEVPSLCRGVFITGGEQLKQEILDVWGPKAVIYNAYGPTEATIGVTMYQRVPINGRPSNIGQQFPNVGSYVFRQGTEIPVIRGGVGELCVSGKLVGKGYLNRPELTEERFPTPREFGERIYRTGDLVRVLHDGCFDFLGRADDQVKLRGQRLEIAEINHAIRTGVNPIQDVATIVTRHGTSGKDVLVCFVVGQTSRAGALRILQDNERLGARAKEACRAKLPGYMVPTYIFALPYIPLSSNNKAEVKELKKLFGELSPELLMELSQATSTPVSAAAIEITGKLIESLAQFSNVEKKDISFSTSIFDVGVDSITALRLSAQLKSRGFHSASPAVLLKYPVVGDLANALSKTSTSQQGKLIREAKQSIQAFGHRYRGVVCRSLGVKPSDIEYIAPCSPLQQGIISRTTTMEPRDAYFNTFQLELKSTTSVQALRTAWESFIATEAILRTAFVPTTNGFIQVALRKVTPFWEEPSIENENMLERYLEEEKADWIRENASVIVTPLRLVCLTTPQSSRLIIHIFHALYDGNSFDMMMRKLLAIFNNEQVPSAPSFIEALSRGPLLRHDSCKPFWEEHLREWFFSPIPQTGRQEEAETLTVVREIPAHSLESVRSAQNVTLQAVAMALWTATLQNYVKNPATIGVVVSGRAIELANVENTIGPLFNTVPFFFKSAEKQTWASLIRRCHEFNTTLLDFQHVPLKNIQKWCAGGRALFDNLFTFQIGSPDVDDAQPWKLVDSHGSPDYPLALEVLSMQDGKLRLTLVCQGNVSEHETLNQLLDRFEENIGLISHSPESDVVIVYGEPTANQETVRDVVRPVDGPYQFNWTEKSRLLQQEIAHLANVQFEDVSPTLTILELGLDSIDVIKLSATLKRQGLYLAPSQIMRSQTIAKMTEDLADGDATQLERANDHQSLQEIKRRLWRHLEKTGLDMETVESTLPPTPLQESMVAGMVQSNFESYFNHDVLEISEAVDSELLRNAWYEVVRRSPILRTGFFEIDEHDLNLAYCQVVAKSTDLDIQHVKLDSLDDAQQAFAKAVKLAQDGKAQKNLFQLSFATLESRRFIVLSMAHALYDGWSLSLLLQDLQTAYEGKHISRAPIDSFLSCLADAEGPEAKEFWHQYLEGAEPTIVEPKRIPDAEVATELQRREQFSKLNISDITSFCKKQSISLQALCQACWAIMLAQQTQRLDVSFGVVVSGRDFDGAEDVVFPTMNTVALRCILSGSPSTFLRYLEENMGDIREFQNYPLRKSQMAANTHGQSLFNTLFILQRSPSSQLTDPMLTSIGGSSATEYPICIEAEALDNGLVWRVACQPGYCVGESPGDLIDGLDAIMKFLMSPETSEILSFEEQGVSICGMSPIQLMDRILPEDAAVEEQESQEEEWDDISSAIREILHQVSDVPASSIRKSITLYNLGLDSISAVKVSKLLRNQHINLRPQDLIRATSISQMAEIARIPLGNGADVATDSSPWVPPSGIETDKLLAKHRLSKDEVELLPALPMQVYMLSAWENAEGCVFYPEFPCHIQGPANFEEVQVAWDSLVSETPLLRTCFIATTSRDIPFLQAILKHHRIPLTYSPETCITSTRPTPLVKIHLSQNMDLSWTFRLRVHHALYDGVSLPALLQRFSELLDGGASINVDKDMAEWRRFAINQSSPETRDTREKFWTSYLPHQGILDDRPKTGSAHSQIDVKERISHLSKSAIPDIAAIQTITAQSGVSVQAVFLAAYAQVLARKRDIDDVVFGIYLANRATEYSLATYPTLNLVPLRVFVPRDKNIIDLAKAVQRDIHLISSEGRSNVGPWEIADWTGLQITSFANFLTLPDNPGDSNQRVKIWSGDEIAQVVEDGPALLASFTQRQKNIVKGSVSMAIDIEACLSNGGLDIGVFGSRQQLSEDEATEIVSEIASHLEEVRF